MRSPLRVFETLLSPSNPGTRDHTQTCLCPPNCSGDAQRGPNEGHRGAQGSFSIKDNRQCASLATPLGQIPSWPVGESTDGNAVYSELPLVRLFQYGPPPTVYFITDFLLILLSSFLSSTIPSAYHMSSSMLQKKILNRTTQSAE